MKAKQTDMMEMGGNISEAFLDWIWDERRVEDGIHRVCAAASSSSFCPPCF